MKLTRVVLIIMGIFSFTSAFGGTLEDTFWKWFQKNESMIFNFDRDQEATFDKLASEMNKINEDLTFEFSPVNDEGKREFVISAGGIKASFPAVESLHSSAPKMENWIFTKYRPRRSPLNNLSYEGISVPVSEVHYKMFKDDDKVGIVVFLEGYSEEDHGIYSNIGFLFLDEALGEYDIETKVGFIEFHNRESKYYEGALPLKELADAFDDYFQYQ